MKQHSRRTRRNSRDRAVSTKQRSNPAGRREADQTWADFYVDMAIADAMFSSTGFTSSETVEGHLNLVLQYEPDHPEALNLLAQLCAQTGRHTEALSAPHSRLTAYDS